MFTERGQGLIRWGVVLLALSVLSGFAIMIAPVPLMGLAGHVQGLLNAVLLIAVGVIWSRLDTPYLGAVIIYWGLIAGAFVTFGVQLVCTFLEIGGTTFPIVAGSHTGSQLEETVVRLLIQAAAAFTTVAVLTATWAALRKPPI